MCCCCQSSHGTHYAGGGACCQVDMSYTCVFVIARVCCYFAFSLVSSTIAFAITIAIAMYMFALRMPQLAILLCAMSSNHRRYTVIVSEFVSVWPGFVKWDILNLVRTLVAIPSVQTIVSR